MEAPTLQLNSSRPAEFEFDVQVQGISLEAAPQVRFAILAPLYAFTFPCDRVSDTKWKVCLPTLEGTLSEAHYPFRVEVIADGYYFEPAVGTVAIVTNPKVAVGQNRPTAAAYITPAVQEPEPPPLPVVPEASVTLLQQVEQAKDEPEPVAEAAPVVETKQPAKKRSIFKITRLGKVTR
jgi:hypothetical protein